MEKIVLLKDNQGNNLYPNSYSEAIKYDKSESGLSAENVQDAIDETNQKWRVRVTSSDSGDSGSGESGNEGGSGSGEGGEDNTPTTAFNYYESEPLATYSGDSDASYYNPIRWKNIPTTSVNDCEVRLKPHSTYTLEYPGEQHTQAIDIYPYKRLLADNSSFDKPTNAGWNRKVNDVIFERGTIHYLRQTDLVIHNDTDDEVGYVFCVGAGYAGPLIFNLKSSDYDESVEPEPGGGEEPTPSEPEEEVQYEEYDAEKLIEKMQDMIDNAMQSSSQTPSSEPSDTPSQVISDASDITFNRATNNLSSENVQAAIEEVNTKVDSIATSDDSSETSLLWENITHVWNSMYPYIMNQGVGEKFKQSIGSVNGYSRNVYKVEPGDKLKFSFNPCASYTYAYYIIGANDIILEAVSKSSGNFSDEVIDIPIGAELFVFNYVTSASQTVYIRRNKNNSIVKDTVYKESDLLGMSERRNLSNKDTFRNKLLTLAWITDTHGDERNYRRFIEYVDAHAGVIDGILHTGDMNRMSDTDGGFEKTVLKYRSKVPLLPVMGNHDSHGTTNAGANETGRQVVSSGSQEWQANKYVVPFMDTKCVRGTNDCYFYRDFDEYKIRIICLHEYDMPRMVASYTFANNTYIQHWRTATGTEIAEASTILNWEENKNMTFPQGTIVNYKGLYLKCTKSEGSVLLDNGDYFASDGRVAWSQFNRDGRYFQQAQVDFLIGALLDNKLTDEWGIVIATHQVVEPYTRGNTANEKFHDGSSYFITSASILQDGNIISDIIGAYVSKGVLNKTYNVDKSKLAQSQYHSSIDEEIYSPVNINQDFSSRKGHIICCLNGHTHNCGCYWLDNCVNPSDSSIKYKILNVNQESGCYIPDSLQQGANTYARFNVSDVIRGGSLAQDCFNIISFDTVNHVVQLLRIGADTTDKHIKRDYARISYEYKTSIPERRGISSIPTRYGVYGSYENMPKSLSYDNAGYIYYVTTAQSTPDDNTDKIGNTYIWNGSSWEETHLIVGSLMFNPNLGRTIIWNGTKWVEEDGASAGVLRMGDSNLRKYWIPSTNIYVGFKYFDTSNSKLLTWNGTSWVDSNGTVIS